MNFCQSDCLNTDCEKHDMNLIQSSRPGDHTFSDQYESCESYEPMPDQPCKSDEKTTWNWQK